MTLMHYVVLGCLKWFTPFIFQKLTINVFVIDYDRQCRLLVQICQLVIINFGYLRRDINSVPCIAC